jgi:hypothetical protein
MKSLYSFLLAATVVCMPMVGRAQNSCGCGLNSGSLGILPLQQRHLVGLRWQTANFTSRMHGSDHTSSEVFQTLGLWGRWQLTPRWQLSGMAPLQFSFSTGHHGNGSQIRGLGDAELVARFMVFDPRRQSDCSWQHVLQLGAGVKLPTGEFRHTGSDGTMLHANLQPGTGSTDALLAATYILRNDAWGFYLDGTARLTTENAEGYRFGNRLNTGLRAFWWKPLGRVMLVPHAGVALDAADLDADQGRYRGDTGGYALYGSLGTELYVGSLALGLTWQHPLAHALAGSLVTPHPRLAATATWMFGRRDAYSKPAPNYPTVSPDH